MADFRISDEDFNAPLEDEDLAAEVVPPSPAWQNLNAASQGNPDAYARDMDLSKKTGVPVQAINSNRDQIEKQAVTGQISEADWNAPLDQLDNPGTAAYLEDPEAAQVSFDDLSILTGLENESKRAWYDIGADTFEGLGDSMMIGMGKVYDQASIMLLNEMRRGEDMNILTGNPMNAGMKKLRDATLEAMEGEEGTDAWNAELDRKIEVHKASLETAEQEIARLTPQNLTLTEEGLRGGIQMVSDMAPGLAISVATRGKFNPTLYMLTGKTYLDSYGSAIVAGKDNETAQQYATIDAALEFATEKLPMKQLEKLVGDLGGTGIKGGIKKWLVTEATGEQIATATQSLNAYAHDLDEELAAAQGWQEVAEIQGRRQAVTFISTLTGGGGMAAGMKGVDYLANREARAMGKLIQKTNNIRGSEFEQERIDNLIYLAQSSKTNERSADQFEAFLEKAAPDQMIYLSSEGVELLTDPPGYIVDQMDGSGGDVQIPLATFLKDFANDETNLELVRPFIKTSEGLSSKTELEQDNDGEYIKSLLAKAAEANETKTAADEIYERITSQLVATGRQSAGTARQSAAIVVAQVTTQYEYLKSVGFKKEDGTEVTLEDLFADFGLEIVGPEVDVGAADFMNQAEQVEADSITLEDGRTYEKQKTDSDHTMVLVDVELFEDLWVDGIGPGPEYSNQISNRMAQYAKFLEQNDRGTWFNRDGEEITIPKVNVQVGNAYVKGPETGYGGYLSMGDGRHRARSMIEQGMKKIPVSMDAESMVQLQAIIDAREAGLQQLELPMDDASRLQRAVDQGFDVDQVWYRGEDQDYGTLPEFPQFASSTRISDEFAKEPGGVTIPVYLRGTKVADLAAMNISPSQGNINEVLRGLRDQGYDLAVYKDSAAIPLIPQNARSIHATFDPDQGTKPSLMAQKKTLPMDKASRLARAEAMGFDTSEMLYHGTHTSSFDEFNVGRAGLIFFTPDLEYAEGYGPNVQQFYLNPGKQFDMVNNPEHLQMAIDMFNAAGGWQRAVELNGVELEEGRVGYEFDGTTDIQWEILDEPETDILSDIREMGFDSFRVLESDGIESVAVFDPTRIRSVDAAFAPEQSGSSRVLAQQNFSKIDLVELVIDEAGNTVEITENAGILWKEQQQRQRNVDKLRGCLRA